MNDKQSSEFILGIANNLFASLIIMVANILIGRFIPNSPREFLDIASLLLPLTAIFMFLYRNKIKKIRIKPSAIIVMAITAFLIISFGVSIRWLYEQRTERTILPVYSSYQQIYDFLAPQNTSP